MIGRCPLLALAPLLLSAYDPGPVIVTPVDPLTMEDDDFARHRDPATWVGLTAQAIEFREERARWRLWRIDAARAGPLWVVPHDDEDAGFDAALAALRRYGGTLVAVDAAPGGADGLRRNRAVDEGPGIDPNRNFHDGLPRYARAMLRDLNRRRWPIIALHTNAPGYDASRSRCPPLGDAAGEGVISIRFCNDTLTPSVSRTRAYPFDDDDSVAFATYRATQRPADAFCAREMVAADFNVVFERVVNSDGSLSNYAVLHRLAYLNFETRDRGKTPADLAAASARLTWMVDRAMALCAGPAHRPRDLPRVTFR